MSPANIVRNVLDEATRTISNLQNRTVDLIEVSKPDSVQYALQLTKIISKLSPLLGNLFEFKVVEELNKNNEHSEIGTWIRQDPGFPDAKFNCKEFGNVNVGVEIKAWFPLSTEITGRFKDSEMAFCDDSINVAIIAWLPEFVFWGKPQIIDTLVVSGKSIAEARDKHYYNPPHYIILEPEDTSNRSVNLQQTNTNGYVFQDEKNGNKILFDKALEEVNLWGSKKSVYSTNESLQRKLKSLFGKYPYRLDTNYAKIDRIEHDMIESFKKKVLETQFKGKKVEEWQYLLSHNSKKDDLLIAIKGLIS